MSRFGYGHLRYFSDLVGEKPSRFSDFVHRRVGVSVKKLRHFKESLGLPLDVLADAPAHELIARLEAKHPDNRPERMASSASG